MTTEERDVKHAAILREAWSRGPATCAWCGPHNGLHATNCPNAPDRFFILKYIRTRFIEGKP